MVEEILFKLTSTTVESGVVTVTPHNVPTGSSIIVAGYKNDYLTFSRDFKNDNNVISFEVPNVELDVIRVYVWDSLNGMKPLSTLFEEIQVAAEAPTLAESNTWYQGSTAKNIITTINVVDEAGETVVSSA